jgi:hypothetical protein
MRNGSSIDFGESAKLLGRQWLGWLGSAWHEGILLPCADTHFVAPTCSSSQ